jgi:hypothetical protein
MTGVTPRGNRVPRITVAVALEGRWVRLHFTDGLVQDVNLAPVFERGGVFSAIRDDRSLFEQVRVNPESGTIEWPGEIDLDPDVLYGTDVPVNGQPLERRVVETAR